MDKLRKILLFLLIAVSVSLRLAGCAKSEQPPKEQPTEKQSSEEHPSSEHPAGEHPAGEHPK